MSQRALGFGVALLAVACAARDEAGGPDAAREQVADRGIDAAAHDTPVAADAGPDAATLDVTAVGPSSDAGGDESDAAARSDAQTDASDAQALASDAGHDAAPGSVCPGSVPREFPPQARRCRTQADCTYAERCTPSYESPGCGACRQVERSCEDGGCPANQVCVDFVPPCSCFFEPSSRCEPRCTSGSCAVDEQCSAQGKCVPRSCQQGHACAPGSVCAPERTLADAHGCAAARCDTEQGTCAEGFRCDPRGAAAGSSGCVPISCLQGFTCPPNRVCSAASSMLHGCNPRPCERDEECGCGVCIAGSCRDELFVCSPPPAP